MLSIATQQAPNINGRLIMTLIRIGVTYIYIKFLFIALTYHKIYCLLTRTTWNNTVYPHPLRRQQTGITDMAW